MASRLVIPLAWYELELAYHVREDFYAFGDGLLVHRRVAEDQAAWA